MPDAADKPTLEVKLLPRGLNTPLLDGSPVMAQSVKTPIPDPRTGPHGGRLYTSIAGTFEVYGAILKKYKSFGGPRSLLGYPITEERGTPDGFGRYNHFEHGSIYWTPATGAHVVYGAIRDRWEALGWEQSALGYPTSDEEDFDEGGRVNQFQYGQIYWWPDTGEAIDLSEVRVIYKGFVCFAETTNERYTEYEDQPYFIFGVVSPTGGAAIPTGTYGDIDSGDSVADMIEIFRGKPGGLVISTTAIERDSGDPNKYREEVQKGVVAASTAAAALATMIPGVGPVLGPAVGAGLAAAKAAITGWVNDFLGTGDDVIGTSALTLTAKQMVLLAARTQETKVKNAVFKTATEEIRGQGANYRAYFTLVVG